MLVVWCALMFLLYVTMLSLTIFSSFVLTFSLDWEYREYDTGLSFVIVRVSQLTLYCFDELYCSWIC